MLPLAIDRCVHGAIVKGLRLRVPDVLAWAAKEGRVFVTQDENTMTGYAWDRVRAGQPMPGVILCGKSVTVGQAIDELELAACCGQPEDFKDQVRFLPLT